MTQRITVMLLFGGESSEHTVSISSARNVYAALDDTKFDIILGFIDKTGKWWLLDTLDQAADTHDVPQLLPVLGTGCFETLPNDTTIKPDVILPILHGEKGEDGTIQGLAELLHIPIVGCGVAASAICIDKILTKQILEYNGIKTVPYAVHMINEPMPSFGQLSAVLGSSLFIKPAGCGSSVGISKANNDEELAAALDEAHKYGNKVLIEKAIKARELEVGMLGSGSKAKASGVGEIKPDSEFYDFKSKYGASSQSKAIIPADISDELSGRIRNIALKAYTVLGCEGLSRIDFFLSDDDILYLNEVNTLPGFTNISMYPKLWQAQGVSYSKLIEEIIQFALKSAKYKKS
jgi:D-alanine-D-alanine ligase